MLQRAAAVAAESERSAALSGIVRQREEQLVAAHLEAAQLQVGRGLRRAGSRRPGCKP